MKFLRLKTWKEKAAFGFWGLSVLIIPFGAILLKDYNTENLSSAGFIGDSNEPSISNVGLPKLINLPPQRVVIGSDFTYFINITDSDTPNEQISVTVLTAPDWVEYDSQLRKLYGTAEGQAGDSVYIEILLDDSDNQVVEKFYLLLSDD